MPSSTTTTRPAAPKAASVRQSSSASRASASVETTITPLPAASPSALIATGRPRSATAAMPASTSVTVSRARGGHARGGHDLLGERLAALQARGGRRRAEGADAEGAQRVAEPGDQRGLGADDHQVGLIGRRQGGDAADVVDAQRDQLGVGGDARRCRRRSRSGVARASGRAPAPGRARDLRLRRPAPCDSPRHSRTRRGRPGARSTTLRSTHDGRDPPPLPRRPRGAARAPRGRARRSWPAAPDPDAAAAEVMRALDPTSSRPAAARPSRRASPRSPTSPARRSARSSGPLWVVLGGAVLGTAIVAVALSGGWPAAIAIIAIWVIAVAALVST